MYHLEIKPILAKRQTSDGATTDINHTVLIFVNIIIYHCVLLYVYVARIMASVCFWVNAVRH